MVIRILGVSASPRKGNSLYLLEKALEACPQAIEQDTIECEIFSFRGKRIGPCMSCYRCFDEDARGACVIARDDFAELREKWLAADVVIYSVPVYHISVPGQLKCFFDRLGNSLYRRYATPGSKHLKVVGCIAQGMHLHSGQELAIQAVAMHALLMNCIPVSGDGWESYTGAAGWTENRIETGAIQEMDSRGDLVTSVALNGARSLVLRAITLARIVRHGGEAVKEELRKDPRYDAFLERVGE